jgi:hypothetical protein
MKRVIVAFVLCAVAAAGARAQTEQWVPYTLKPEQVSVRVWTAVTGDRTHARVTIVFNDGGYRVADWGTVQRQGNTLSVDIKPERWTGFSIQMLITRENFYDLGQLSAGAHSFIVKSRGAQVARVDFDPSQVVEDWEEASLERADVRHAVWTDADVTFASACLTPPDDGYRVVSWGDVVRSGNDFSTLVRLERWTGRADTNTGGETCRVFQLGANLPPNDTFTFTVRFTDGVAHASFPFTPAGQRRNGMHPLDSPSFLVRQHYVDFFSREPDNAGLNFWYNEVANTCAFNAECIDRKRTHTSAAFFYSIEFQETGFLVHRLYKAAYGAAPTFARFLPDTREVAAGLIVGQEGWQARLAANKSEFVERFTSRAEFREKFPETMSPEQYVAALDANATPQTTAGAGGLLSQTERDELANGLRNGTETRATVLRKIAENEQFSRSEFRPAFVRMQYFGYMRRDPDQAGFDFWLKKLNDHDGDFVAAEMVRSFLISGEYRGRFAQ